MGCWLQLTCIADPLDPKMYHTSTALPSTSIEPILELDSFSEPSLVAHFIKILTVEKEYHLHVVVHEWKEAGVLLKIIQQLYEIPKPTSITWSGPPIEGLIQWLSPLGSIQFEG
jgi:hypothetical protein